MLSIIILDNSLRGLKLNYLQRAKKFRTKKRLGQNFLVDANIIEKIIEESSLSRDDVILEIGPGIGFVTEKIAQLAAKVLAVEVDDDAIEELEKLSYSNIKIINEDILKVDISELTDNPIKIIANIPYYITSPIIVHLLGEIDEIEHFNRKMVKEIMLMVQYEVAQRIVANEKSASKEYGLLSILVNYWAEPELIAKVPARSFYPAPKVDSALIKLKVRDKPAIKLNNPKLFRRIIRASFRMRRKTIKNALVNSGFDNSVVIEALSQASISPAIRGEKLSIQDFEILARAIEEIMDGKSKSKNSC